MPALNRLPATESVASMQSINRLAVTPVFMTLFVGTALLCLGLGIWAVTALDRPEARWALAGCALYVIGTFVVTMAANVPLNDALERVTPDGATAGWSDYSGPWTLWNHVRLATSTAAAALLTVALVQD